MGLLNPSRDVLMERAQTPFFCWLNSLPFLNTEALPMTTTRPVLRMESLLRQPGLHLPEEWACGMRLHAPGAGLRLACLDVRLRDRKSVV